MDGLLKFVLVCGLVFFAFVNPYFRYSLMHPIKTVSNAIKDVYEYIHYKRYNEFRGYGKIENYIANSNQAFGCGKTLTMVNQVIDIYNRYDGKYVYDYEKGIFVKQRIRVFSNVAFTNIPYIPFTGITQFARLEEYYKTVSYPYDEPFQTQDIIIFAVDEIGHVFNSRDFKTNFSTETLTRMLQVRKNKVLWIGTSQRWSLIDKIIRETSSEVTTCRKWWRFVLLQTYDAWELENAKSQEMLKPLNMRVWFALNKDYDAYDTNQLVEELNKQVEDGDFIQTEDILARAGQEVQSDIRLIPNRHLSMQGKRIV